MLRPLFFILAKTACVDMQVAKTRLDNVPKIETQEMV